MAGEKKVKFIAPLLVIVACVGIAAMLIAFSPEAERRDLVDPVKVGVEAITLRKSDYQITLQTSGTVKPRTEGTLIPQIGGTIVAISPNARDGAFFEKGELLAQIDDRDYRADVVVAESAFRDAELRYAEEQARASQATRDWERLGSNHNASDLVLRKPQLAAAAAAVASAKARLSIARLNLERTKIKAPYAGRVLSKKVDVGQVVSSGTVLAEIYAVDYVEIRLPLNSRQIEFIQLPEIYRRSVTPDVNDISAEPDRSSGPKVTLFARIGRQSYAWLGVVTRAEGAIDLKSRQLFVVAQVDDPYGQNADGRPPLKVGQFVTASIQGTKLQDVYVIPRETLYQNNEIVLIKEEKIYRQQVEVVWQNQHEVVIAGDLAEGDLLATTSLPNVISGTAVGEVILLEQGKPTLSAPAATAYSSP